jgi:hypothetical protein
VSDHPVDANNMIGNRSEECRNCETWCRPCLPEGYFTARLPDSKDARIAELEARILELETVTDEKVERAAKAMCKADGWHNSKGYQSLARAALMAGR